MAPHVCPPWLGYVLLLNPLRRLLENPDRLLGPFVREGMMVLEPGPGLGYFTLPLARMVGAKGRVVVVDVQAKMLEGLRRRAERAGLLERLDLRRVDGPGLGLGDLAGKIDFAAAIYMVHEVPDPAAFFADVFTVLKPGGKLLLIEPKGHVSAVKFEEQLATARRAGFAVGELPVKARGRGALLERTC